MYAVIETGGKQYRVEVGTELDVELLDVEPGTTVTLDRVLLVADGDDAAIGRPVVDGAAVSAEVVRQTRGDKVIAFKYRPKARRRVKKGHRQELTVLRVSDIVLDGKSAAKAAAKAGSDAQTERRRLEDAAAAQAAKDAELAAKLAAGTKPAPAKKATTTARRVTASDTKASTTRKATSTAKVDAAAGPKAKAAPAPDAATPTPDAAKPAKPAAKPRAVKPRSTKKDE
jgi:large subunit ribosomal protein L21